MKHVRILKVLRKHSLQRMKRRSYTDVRIILAQLSGVAAAGTENRMDKVYILYS